MLALRQIFNLAEFIVTSGQLASISLSACYLTFSVRLMRVGPPGDEASTCTQCVPGRPLLSLVGGACRGRG